MLFIRSILFKIAFYINATVQFLLFSIPFFFVSQANCYRLANIWSRSSVWLHNVIIGTKLEVRGLENIPTGPFIVACKHQSSFETIALLPLFRQPSFIFKKSLESVPLFGMFLKKLGSVPVDRGKGGVALQSMSIGVTQALATDHQVIIFPEGTRRSLTAPAQYKYGIRHLYETLDIPVLPIAINAGAFWPKGKIMHGQGTIIFEILPVIEPGLDGKKFKEKLVSDIETKSLVLLHEAAEEGNHYAVEACAQLDHANSE